MQNRSFDHLFGQFPGNADGIRPEVSGYLQFDLRGNPVVPRKLETDSTPDLPHETADYERAMNDGAMDRFASTMGAISLRYYDDTTPGLRELWDYAQQYSLADQHFALLAVNPPTESPAADDVSGLSGTAALKLRRWDAASLGLWPDTFPAIADQLTTRDLDWSLFSDDGKIRSMTNPVSALSDHGLARLKPLQAFYKELDSNSLPSISFVFPSVGHDMHPGRGPASSGLLWLAALLRRIRESSTWDSVAVIVVWDESGGWWDHVGPPNLDRRYGPRVPMLFISPFAKRGYVSHTLRDHVAILRFIQWNWGVPAFQVADFFRDQLADMINLNEIGVPVSNPASPTEERPQKSAASEQLGEPLNSVVPESQSSLEALTSDDGRFVDTFSDQTIGGNKTATGNWMFRNVNQVRYADLFPSIQAAIADLPPSGGFVMLSPNRVYFLTAGLTTGSKVVHLKGGGRTTIVIGTNFAIYTITSSGSTVEDVVFRANGGFLEAVGVEIKGINNWMLKNVYIENGNIGRGIGMKLTGALKGQLIGGEIWGWNRSVEMSGRSGANQLLGAKIRSSNAGIEILSDFAGTIFVQGCTIEGNAVGISMSGFPRLFATNNHFEQTRGPSPTSIVLNSGLLVSIGNFYGGLNPGHDIYIAAGTQNHLSLGDALFNGITHASPNGFTSKIYPVVGADGIYDRGSVVAVTSNRFSGLPTGTLSITGYKNMTFDAGVNNDGKGFKHKRVDVGPVPPGGSTDVVMAWGNAFLDASYTASCSVVSSTASLTVEAIRTQLPASLTVAVKNRSADAAQSGVLHCTAIHD